MKKITSIFLIFMLIITSNVNYIFAADFGDLNKNHKNYDAIIDLVNEKIIKGYPDGNFKPENNITRAEFSALLCRALKLDGEVDRFEKASVFKDVSKKHWAVGYINLLYSTGIINGVGNGNFKPEDNVTYEQAIKMVVLSLGPNEQEANKLGGYPKGYLTMADNMGLNKNINGKINSPATRSMIAQIIYNGNFKNIKVTIVDNITETNNGNKTVDNKNDIKGNISNIKIGMKESDIKENSYRTIKTDNGKWNFYNNYNNFFMIYFNKENKIEYVYSMDTSNFKDAKTYKDTNDGDKIYAVSIGNIAKDNADITEQLVFEITNGFRGKYGKSPLKWNDKLAKVARDYSKDMNDRKFFSHNDPDGKNPGDRLKSAGYNYNAYGENIILGYANGVEAMNGWINSSGHRKNILVDYCDEIGIGWYNSYGTQNMGSEF